MLRLIYTTEIILRDHIVSLLQLQRHPMEISENFQVYQRGDWLLIVGHTHTIDQVLPTILENWDPDHLYLPYFGRSVDRIHEIGDVILPNTFCRYVPEVATLDTESEDPIIPEISARFLTVYDDQRDYYVEDYGLSIGGIIVDQTPDDPALATALMMTYEADIYTSVSLDSAYIVASGDLVPTVILCGVIEGQKNPHSSEVGTMIATRNILSTIQLLETESESESKSESEGESESDSDEE